MTDDLMQVELVAADRLVWSGEAKMVIARTTEGDVGILPNHAPMLSLMVQGIFLSVANNRISVLAEHAEMSHDIDLEKARAEFERCRVEGAEDSNALEKAEAAWAEARVRAAEKAS